MTRIHPEVLRRFGRDPKEIFRRDGYKCLECGTKDDLTIDHRDGNGRNSKHPNNELSNLQTLCRRCHGSKDGKRRSYYGKDTIRIKKCIVCQKEFDIKPSEFERRKTCSIECRKLL